MRRLMRRNKRPADVDITSLLDILVTLLFFLLLTLNTTGAVMDMHADIKLPVSSVDKISSNGVVVQVSPEKIWVDNVLVLDAQNVAAGSAYDMQGRRIISLFEELVKKKELIKELEKTSGAKAFSGQINLIVDKSIKYNLIKKILFTSAEAGYRQYKMIVLGETVTNI